jgi:hypothetical protein
MPLMKGRTRMSVRSDEMGDVSEDRAMVKRGTW